SRLRDAALLNPPQDSSKTNSQAKRLDAGDLPQVSAQDGTYCRHAPFPSAPAGAPDGEDYPEAVHERDQVTKQSKEGEQRYAEQRRSLCHGHHNGIADHKRRGHDADSRPIDCTVQAMAETVEAFEVEIDAQPTVSRVLNQPRQVTRH